MIAGVAPLIGVCAKDAEKRIDAGIIYFAFIEAVAIPRA